MTIVFSEPLNVGLVHHRFGRIDHYLQRAAKHNNARPLQIPHTGVRLEPPVGRRHPLNNNARPTARIWTASPYPTAITTNGTSSLTITLSSSNRTAVAGLTTPQLDIEAGAVSDTAGNQIRGRRRPGHNGTRGRRRPNNHRKRHHKTDVLVGLVHAVPVRAN